MNFVFKGDIGKVSNYRGVVAWSMLVVASLNYTEMGDDRLKLT